MRSPSVLLVVLGVAAAGCTRGPDTVLGTLERDRITLPAPVSERIADIVVREGDRVAAGGLVMTLESTRTQARLDAARAEVSRVQSALDEARAGPRREAIDESRARLSRSESVAVNTRRDYERVEVIVGRKLLPAADLDRTRAVAAAADADVVAARSALAALVNGTRIEEIAQAEAALSAAQAQVTSLAVDFERTQIMAPRAGTVDSLPFEVGDQVPVGTSLATLLVGEVPYARVYIPQPLRARVQIASPAVVFVQGNDTAYRGRIRAIRSEPSFTPYYALSGSDAARLSYLAEIELAADAAALPTGLPVRAEFMSEDP